MIKIQIKPDEINPSYNSPKTYAIVLKGTDKVVMKGFTPMYFRGKRAADEFLYQLELESIGEEYEIIQLRRNKYYEVLSDSPKLAKNNTARMIRPPTLHTLSWRTNKKNNNLLNTNTKED